MRTRNLDCVLLGGLGNQLFQLSAAITLAGDRDVALLTIPGYFGHPVDGGPAIGDLELPKRVSITTASAAQASMARLVGRTIRETHQESRMRSSLGLWAASALQRFGVIGQHEQGDGGLVDERNGSNSRFLFGFWQSSAYAEALKNYAALEGLHPKWTTDLEEKMMERALRERPVMIHVRLGDYRSAADFGMLTTAYYRRALSFLDVGKGDSVWVFSDEPMEARLLLSPLNNTYDLHYPEIGRPQMRASQLLDVFRWGRKYVIANSTLSWWGAFLSHEPEAPVAAPRPWFARLPEPIGLIPSTWLRVAR